VLRAGAERNGVREDTFVRVARLLVYAGAFILPMLRFKVTQGLDVSDFLFLLAAMLLLLSRRPPKPAPRTPAWYVGAFLFILTGVIASTQSPTKAASLLVVGNSIFVFFVLQYLLRQLLDTTVRIQIAIGAFVIGASLSAFVAILQTTLHIFLPAHVVSNAIGGNSRALGLSTQPNLLGVSLALGIVFAVGMLMELGFRRHKYLGACLAVLIAALLLSASVGGLASTAVGLIVLFVLRGVRLRTVISVLAVLGVVYVLVFGVIDRGSHLDPISRIEQTTNANSGKGTLSLRIGTIKVAWDGITQKPIIGHGLDQATLAPYWDQYIYTYYPPHDIIFVYWYGGGIFMLVAVMIMMGSSFNRLLSGRRKRGRANTGTRDIVLVGMITVLFFSLQGPELVDRWLWFPFMLALCFRDPPAPAPTAATTAQVALDVPEVVTAAASPRRVSGRVGRHAAGNSDSET
jgi:hypothetical protein